MRGDPTMPMLGSASNSVFVNVCATEVLTRPRKLDTCKVSEYSTLLSSRLLSTLRVSSFKPADDTALESTLKLGDCARDGAEIVHETTKG